MQNKSFFIVGLNYFDSDMSKSTNTVVYFDWKTVVYIYPAMTAFTDQYSLPNIFLKHSGFHDLFLKSIIKCKTNHSS
jgi:hypothetical protein